MHACSPYDAVRLQTMRQSEVATGTQGAGLRPGRSFGAWPRPLPWALLLLSLVAPRVARAHARTSSFSVVELGEAGARWALRLPPGDLLAPVGLPETVPDAAELLRPHLGAAETYVRDRLRVSRAELPCAARSVASPTVSGSPAMVEFRFAFACGESGPYRLGYELFFDLDPLHSGFVQLSRGAGVDSVDLGADVFRSTNRELTVLLSESGWGQVHRFWLLGVEHIFTGYDHLAFLAGLLVMAAACRAGNTWVGANPRQAWWGAAKLVTAFTVAHSLTLALAALRPGLLPTEWVEPAIALSVAFIGAENLLPRVPRRRWLLAFAFGLIHGFGFASVLEEVGLPQAGLVRALLAFNVGVESGQLALVAVCLPLLVWLARAHPRLYTWVFLRGASLALVAAGVTWFFARV